MPDPKALTPAMWTVAGPVLPQPAGSGSQQTVGRCGRVPLHLRPHAGQAVQGPRPAGAAARVYETAEGDDDHASFHAGR